MPEPRILICSVSTHDADPLPSLELLRNVTLPNASKFLVVTGKFETKEVKKFNVEADYPPEPAQLKTLAAWAEVNHATDPRWRDGFDLFCLRRILKKNGPFSYAILLRTACGFEGGWTELAQKLSDKPFLVFGRNEDEHSGSTSECNVLFHLEGKHSGELIEEAWQVYASGTVYAFENCSFDIALDTAAESLRIQQGLNG